MTKVKHLFSELEVGRMSRKPDILTVGSHGSLLSILYIFSCVSKLDA